MSSPVDTRRDRQGHHRTAADDRDRRSRATVLALALLSALFFSGALASALSGGSLFGGGSDDADERRGSGLPPGWASLDPLLPLAPSLRDMADMRRDAADGPSRVLRGQDGIGGLRLRERPTAVGARRVVPTASVRRPRVRVPLAGVRPVATVTRLTTPITDRLGDVDLIAIPDLGSLPDRPRTPVDVGIPPIGPPSGGPNVPPIDVPEVPPIDVPEVNVPPIDVPEVPPIDVPEVSIPPIVPPPGTQVPGTGPTLPGGILRTATLGTRTAPTSASSLQAASDPLAVTVLDSGADPAFDVLLASSGDQVLERYVFRDRDVAGLAMQMNLRSRLLVADALPGSTALDHVVRASVGGGALAAAEQGADGDGERGRAASDARTADSGAAARGGSDGAQSTAATGVSSQRTEGRSGRSTTTTGGARRGELDGDRTGGSGPRSRSGGSGGGAEGDRTERGKGPKAGRGSSKPRRSAGRAPEGSSRGRGHGRKPERGGSPRGNGRGGDKSKDDDGARAKDHDFEKHDSADGREDDDD